MLENIRTILAFDIIALLGVAATALGLWKRHVSPLIKSGEQRRMWERDIHNAMEQFRHRLTQHEGADQTMIARLDAMTDSLQKVHVALATLETTIKHISK